MNNIGFGVEAKGVAKASSDLDNFNDKLTKLQKQGAKGIGLGIAAGATTFALGAMKQAVGEVTDVIGDSIQAAREDEVSIQKLGTALRDNVPAWDGNTDAIERTIKSRIALGFADEDQRSGLATLVATTHDATKALDLERGAMDIARARGLDLATVTDAVAKAYGGNTKQLKSLIPGLNLGHSSAEALANAFAAVKGASNAYADTSAGKMEVAQAKVNEAMERFGTTILPTVTDALVDASNAVVGATTVLDFYQKGLAKTSDGQKDQLQGAIDLGHALGLLFPPLAAITDAEQRQVDALAATNKAYDDNMDAMHNMRVKEQSDLTELSNSADDWRDTWHDDTGQIIRDSAKVRSQLAKDAQGLIDGYFNPIEEHTQATETHFTTLSDIATLASANTATQVRKDSAAIVSDLDTQATALADLGAQGALTQGDVDGFTSDVEAAYKEMGLKVPADLQLIIDKLKTLAKMPNISKTVTINGKTYDVPTSHPSNSGKVTPAHPGGGGPQEFDSGGVVAGPVGSAQDAIVHGGETVRTPSQEAALHTGGGDTYIYNVYPQGRWDVDKNSVGAAVQRLRAISRKRAA